MTVGMRVRLTPAAREQWKRSLAHLTGTVALFSTDWIAIDFDGYAIRVWLPASNVEEITNG